MRLLGLLGLLVLCLSGCVSVLAKGASSSQQPLAIASEVASDVATEAATCAVTQPFQDQPPDDPNASSFGFGNWHINADRSIWVNLPADGTWGTGGEKAVWIRPAGTELMVSGQRLDAKAEPLRASIPCCYPTGFQATGMFFPTEGCWEVIATAGEHELRFITEVKNDAPPEVGVQPSQRGVDPTSPLASSVLLRYCDSAACELRPVDPQSGTTQAGFSPVDLGRYAAIGLSNDGTQLAAIAYRNNNRLQDGLLKFVDLATWHTITTTLTFDDAYLAPAFSPDNSYLAVVAQESQWPSGKVVYLVDVTRGELLAEQRLNFHPSHLQFTVDGSGLMLFGAGSGENEMGTNATTQVALLDGINLENIWQQPVEGLLNGNVMDEVSSNPHAGIWWQPAVVFAPDKAMLYVVHADKEALTTIDFAAQRVTTRAMTKPLSWIERLLALTARTAHAKMLNGTSKQAALSADGAHLYVVATRYRFEDGEFAETMSGLQVIDLATSQEVTHIDTTARSVSVEPISGRIFLHGWGEEGKYFTTEWTEVLDASSYESLMFFTNKAVVAASRLDGQPILLSTATLQNGQSELTVIDPETFEPLSTSADWHDGYVGWVIAH